MPRVFKLLDTLAATSLLLCSQSIVFFVTGHTHCGTSPDKLILSFPKLHISFIINNFDLYSVLVFSIEHAQTKLLLLLLKLHFSFIIL